MCKDLPADPRAEPRARQAVHLPALLRPRLLLHRARAGAGEHRGIHVGARGSAGAAVVELQRPPGCGPAGGARRPAGADAGS